MPETYLMKLDDIPFKATQSGKKIIEVRLNDDKRKEIKVGDIILFENLNDRETVMVEVVRVRKFKTLSELVKTEDFSKTGGIYRDRKHWQKSINSYYTPEKQRSFGLLVIEISLADL
ncbi:MAG: ASCH domain-containing protein [Bacteriovoracia bacterium]